MDRGRMACSGTCSSILGRVYLLVPPTPLPPVYWNHRLSDKTRNNILESTAYGQNLEPEGLSGLLGPQVVWNQPMPRTGSRLKSFYSEGICAESCRKVHYLVAILFL